MANHGMRQQKKLAKQKAKRSEKRTQVVRQTSSNPMIRFAECASWPIISTLVPGSLWDNGIGNLFIARRAPDGMLVVGCFLVDAFCLGVKDASWLIVSDGKYQEMIERSESAGGPLNSVKPEFFAKLILDAVDYAAALQLPPHPDFRTARLLLNGIDPTLCDVEFDFGQDGKPCYIQGPHDTPEKIRLIMSRITASKGDFVLSSQMPDTLPALLEDESIDADNDDEDD